MSKQLAISSAFSIFAMACLTLLGTSDRAGMSASDTFMQVQAELPSPDLQKPSFLP
ncbi:MAG: hypothetical protein ABJP34_05785 [Erythrobacter sp.]